MRDYDDDHYSDLERMIEEEEATSGLTRDELEDLKDCIIEKDYLNEMVSASYHL